MAVTIGVLCAMQNQVQLRRHVGAALDLGLAPRAVVEILVQTGIYRGFAASESAIETALAVFAERGITIAVDPPRTDPLAVLTARGRGLQADRESVVPGKSVEVRVDIGGGRISKKT